ncbi:MAG: UDP-diphosphatase [Parcubacteria group bacterium]|jgi:undecaprenyl-diphosphatase|nr:UDP-diphosphatase [Parcubacteria group bacterium]|tara:strand:- start:15437 stop:16195 length:759 start_codon:yes stop_codon:yes gene_type:complete
MLEAIVLGIIQGVTEWLPVSSEGVLVLVQTRFFGKQDIEQLIRQALFLHLGTFLAAFLYFRKDVFTVFKRKALFNFLLITTIITGILGYALLRLFINLGEQVEFSGKLITLAIGLLLLITAILQIKVNKKGDKKVMDLTKGDSVLLGVVQGLAVLPGLSRSGLTISALLLRKFDNASALKLSFLMSLPVVLGGNIVLNFKYFTFSTELLLGLIFSFIFGLLTISLLLKIARKVNFGWFVLIFGVVMIISIVF